MYTLVAAIARPVGGGGRWTSVALGEMLLPEVFTAYDRVLATLSHPYLDKHVCLDLATIRADYGSQDITFNQLLTLNGDATLDTLDEVPVLKTRYAKYSDVHLAGYKLQAVHPTASPDASVLESEKTWILMSKKDLDYNLFYESVLVSVNGFLHPTDVSDQGVYVKEGMVSQHLSGKAELGILSFRELGKLSFVPITADMVYKQDAQQKLSDRAHVDIGQDVSDKTVMLVLGGYLHILDERTFYRVSDSGFAVVFNNLPLLDRYYDSRNYIDLSSLGIEISSQNPAHIVVEDLLSDAALTAYLSLPQSFFVILDNPNVFVERAPIHTSALPGVYVSHIPPAYPLLSEIGKMVNYWYQYETGQYSVTVTDAYRHDYNYRTVAARQALSLGDNRNPGRPFANGDLQYLQIGADL